jgi:hypothetical protein
MRLADFACKLAADFEIAEAAPGCEVVAASAVAAAASEAVQA